MNTLTIHKTTYDSTNYGWLEYGLEYRIGNAEIHRKFSSSPIHCALDYKFYLYRIDHRLEYRLVYRNYLKNWINM